MGVDMLGAKKWRLPEGIVSAMDNWKPEDHFGLRLDTPFRLEESKDAIDLPAEVMKRFSTFQMCQGTSGDRLYISVNHIAMKDGYKPDFEGAVKGSVQKAAEYVGDNAPDYTQRTVEIDGIEGRRVSYKPHVEGKTMSCEQVLVLREQELWQVCVISMQENGTAEIDRILGSIHFIDVR
jgi:hypothetical protein